MWYLTGHLGGVPEQYAIVQKWHSLHVVPHGTPGWSIPEQHAIVQKWNSLHVVPHGTSGWSTRTIRHCPEMT